MALTPRQHMILRAFYGKRRTVREVSDELEIGYETAIKDVRPMIEEGYLEVLPYRQGKKRWLTAAKLPSEISDVPVEQSLIPWNGKLVSIGQAIQDITAKQESSIKMKLVDLMCALQVRGMALSKEKNASGWSARDIRFATRKLLGELTEWHSLIKLLLESPIWYDAPELEQRIGFAINEETLYEFAKRIELHCMTTDRRILDAYLKRD